MTASANSTVTSSANSPSIRASSPTHGSNDNSFEEGNFEDDAYEQENNDFLEKSEELYLFNYYF